MHCRDIRMLLGDILGLRNIDTFDASLVGFRAKDKCAVVGDPGSRVGNSSSNLLQVNLQCRIRSRDREAGTDRFEYAEQEPDASTDDVSGTSYAAPQVAAAAALWVEAFFHQLPQPGDVDAWKTVEAFRAAVVESARTVFLRIDGRRRRIDRPRLDIERLLGRAPDLVAVTSPASAAIRHGNQQ